MRIGSRHERIVGEVFFLMADSSTHSNSATTGWYLTAGSTSGILSLLAIVLSVLFGDLPPPTPSPVPHPVPIVVPDEQREESQPIKFSWVTDAQGAVLADESAKPLLAAANCPAGAYTVHRVGSKVSSLAITIGGKVQPTPSPTPTPEPTPQPEPQPKPKPAELWGIVIEESSQRTPQQAAVLLSTDVRKLFGEGLFRVIDKDTNVDPRYAPYLQKSVGQSLPKLWLVDAAGEVYFSGTLPSSVADMANLVKEWQVP